MATKELRKFFVVVVDEDRGLFNVLGPMVDDTGITNGVYEAQQTGREVRCFSVEMPMTQEAIIQQYAAESGMAYVTESVL